jgi:putative oxidoreductase
VAMIRATCVASMTGALLIAMGLWPDLGALLVLAFLVPVTLTMHRFWEVQEWLPRKQKRDSFLSNMSMAGGALLLFAAVNQSHMVPLALLPHPLFGRA